LDTSLLKFHIYNSSQSLRFQYPITTFELICTSNLDTTLSWLIYWQTWSYITNYYAKTCFFYSPLLIQICWITCDVGSLTSRSDHSSNGRMISCACCYCDVSSNGRGDALEPVATVIHQNLVPKDKHIYITIINQKSVPKAKDIYIYIYIHTTIIHQK
jgi:hypothetical protein